MVHHVIPQLITRKQHHMVSPLNNYSSNCVIKLPMKLLTPNLPLSNCVIKLHTKLHTQHLMHKIRGNYSSCTGRISENLCSRSGGAQKKGNRVFCRFLFYFTRLWNKLRVLVLCFPGFTENSNFLRIYHGSNSNFTPK